MMKKKDVNAAFYALARGSQTTLFGADKKNKDKDKDKDKDIDKDIEII